jgi:hypothetical protein
MAAPVSNPGSRASWTSSTSSPPGQKIRLTGDERPSQLYSWISALEFDGEALPDGYSLDTATLLLREALAEVEFVDEHPLFYNRITRLSPLNGTAGRHAGAP